MWVWVKRWPAGVCSRGDQVCRGVYGGKADRRAGRRNSVISVVTLGWSWQRAPCIMVPAASLTFILSKLVIVSHSCLMSSNSTVSPGKYYRPLKELLARQQEESAYEYIALSR